MSGIDFNYFPNPVPENIDDLRRYINDELQRISTSFQIAPRWDDLRFPTTGDRLDSASTRYSFDSTELGVTFDNDSRYPNEQLSNIVQIPHAWREQSGIRPHIHWIQNQSAIPNWLMAYRVYNNNETPGTFTEVALSSTVFTYTTGSIVQISSFPEIDMTGMSLSCFVDIKIWRDTTNASGVFAGADPVATGVLLKEYDIHYLVDSFGSPIEFVNR